MIGLIIHKSDYFYKKHCFTDYFDFRILATQDKQSPKRIEESSMSLINTQVKAFNATAYHNGQFIDVSEQDFIGKWSVVFFYPADFTFVCPTELADLADQYAEFQNGCGNLLSIYRHALYP